MSAQFWIDNQPFENHRFEIFQEKNVNEYFSGALISTFVKGPDIFSSKQKMKKQSDKKFRQ